MVASEVVYINVADGIEIRVTPLPLGAAFAAKVVLTDTDAAKSLPAKLFESEGDALAYGVELAEANRAERVYSFHTWGDTMTAMMALQPGGARIEIDAKTYDYFLSVLPPVYQGFRRFGFAEGRERVRLFTMEVSFGVARYFCQLTEQWNPFA